MTERRPLIALAALAFVLLDVTAGVAVKKEQP